MTRRKIYNPFLLFGSFIGIGILVFLRYLDLLGRLQNLIFFYEPTITNKFPDNAILIGVFNTIIIGFLLGWVVHSLFRKFGRK